MKSIENNYRISECLFCKSGQIKKTGDLYYHGKTEFSTHIIDLKIISEIWECIDCKSAFTQNSINPKEAEDLYATGEGSKRWSSTDFVKDKTDKVINGLEKLLSGKSIKVLDIGCNTGEFLDYSKQKGNKTFGLEICKESCDVLRKKGHHAYRFPNEINETFDVITAFDVVEHLYDPTDFFSSVHKMLNSNGRLVILTGNPLSRPAKSCKEKWWYFNYPEHVGFPSPGFFSSLKGFELKDQLDTYASKMHEKGNIISKLKDIALKIIGASYSGLPAISPDHQFVILQKK
jgi:SAM-dependent methyltransferase